MSRPMTASFCRTMAALLRRELANPRHLGTVNHDISTLVKADFDLKIVYTRDERVVLTLHEKRKLLGVQLTASVSGPKVEDTLTQRTTLLADALALMAELMTARGFKAVEKIVDKITDKISVGV